MIAKVRLATSSADRPGKSHGLPGELVVSLTSFPPRFPNLHLTLGCLIDQTIRADRIILWIANEDYRDLPRDVAKLGQTDRLEIRTCDDLGPFKKLVPALEALPDAFIATADDDLYYPRRWLQSLIEGFDGSSIVCRRANRINGRGEIQSRLFRGPAGPTEDLLPSSGAGVLFPPRSLHPTATNKMFLSLCPTADDLWYYCMARMKRTKFKKVRVRRENPIAWIGSQEYALWNENEERDAAVLANLIESFGLSSTRLSKS